MNPNVTSWKHVIILLSILSYKIITIHLDMSKGTVVIGLLGATLDVGRGPKRWARWRPTVSVCQQADWHVDRCELIVNPAHAAQASIAETVAADILAV